MKCPKCNRELKAGAKFCGGCGNKIVLSPPPQESFLACPNCNNPLSPVAKYCTKCGTQLKATQTAEATANVVTPDNSKNAPEITPVNSYIHWNILQGQLAVKLDEKDIASYGKTVKGIDIQEGIKALLFIQGKLVGELASGRYQFKDWQEDNRGIIKRGLDSIRSFFVGLWDKNKAEAIQNMSSDTPFSFVLIRTNEFPLIYNLSDVHTASVSCDIGLHLLCRISNINEFYMNNLLDQKFVGFEKIASKLKLAIKTQLDYAFTSINPEQVRYSQEISDLLLQKLQPVISEIYPYVKLTRILNVSAQNEDLENFRRMSEELYVAERELVELTKRNDFLNRFQNAQNEQEIIRLKSDYAHENTVTDINYAQEEYSALKDNQHSEAMQSIENSHELTELKMATTQDIEKSRVEAEYPAVKEKIYEEMELTEDERAKFDLMLSAQRKLREAKSDEEIAAAMHEFRKSGMFREQEIQTLQQQIAHDAKLRELNDAQVLAMATMQNQMALDQQKLDWEIQIGNKRIQNQFDRQRIEDAYNDERRDKEYAFSDQRREKDAAFEDSRRRSAMEMDRQEQENQLDMLKKAQAMRLERENAEHQREMEAVEAARRHELETQRLAQEAEQAKLDAANEEKRIYAGMTFEQIMAANPNLTPQAAQALAKKYEAEAESAKAQAAIAQNDKTAQMAIDQQNQMMAFMQQQMAMMKDISMAGINAGAVHQQAMLDAKQAELDRTRSDSSANSDRFVDGMKTTIQAVGNMNRPIVSQPQMMMQPQPQQMAPMPQMPTQPAAEPKQVKRCPNCNSENSLGEAFCLECGESL